MINFTLKQLRYFEAVARFGHFGQAADVCGISQPAISVQIKELEAALGAALFERAARQVRLTAFGEVFAARVGPVLRAVDDLGDLARVAQTNMVGKLRIGIIPTIAPYLLPNIIRQLSATFPGIDVHVRETVTPRLTQELAEGLLDAAILALPISEPSFNEVRLFDENLLLVRPVSDADLPIPNSDHLRDMRLLLLEEGHCFRDQALSFCNLHSALPREGLDGSSLSTLVQMVGAGIGVTLIPEMAVTVETRSADVDVVPLPDPQPARTIGMIWRKTSPLSDQLAQVSDIVRNAVTL